jgi:parallel beta-helix repeat protein
MPGNGRVFISHSHDDNARCQPLLDALAQWGVDVWFDRERMDAGQHISQRIQNAITERDLFIRVCSTAVQNRPFWVNLETDAFMMLMGEDENAGQHGKRRLISLVLDAGYKPLPFERVALIIHAHNQSREAWLAELRRAVLPAGGVQRHTQAGGYDRIVDWRRGAGDHTTITDAIAAARPGERILVRAGVYHEGLVIEKPLEIVGDGALGDVVIEATAANALRFNATNGRATNLTLRQMGSGHWASVDIEGGRLDLEGCDISSEGGSCVAIRNDSDPRIRRNRIHDGWSDGIIVSEQGRGLIEDNEIVGNRLCGVETARRGNPTVRKNRITKNSFSGVRVNGGSGGTFEDNDLRGNSGGAWSIEGFGSQTNVRQERNLV